MMAIDQETAVSNNNSVLLTFVVGPYRLCASSERVVGIIAPPPLARLPGSSNCQRGIFFHHGRTVMVIGLRCKFGLPLRTRRDTGQLILVEIGHELAGFWVDEVLDAPETQHAVWRDTPPALRDGVFDRLAVLNQELFLYVDFERLLYARSEDIAAALGALALDADRSSAAPAENILPEAKPAIESAPAAEQATAATNPTPADVTAVASPPTPRAPVRATPPRAPVSGRTTPHQRLTGAKPVPRAAALVSNTRLNANTRSRDWSQYTTPATATAAAHSSTATGTRGSDRTLAWALGTIVVAVLLVPLLWLLLSTSGRSGAKSASPATRQSAAIETTRAGSSSLAAGPAPATTAREAPADAGQNEILKVDTADFVMTVERADKTGKNPAATSPPAAVAATGPAARPGAGAWQEFTHVVQRGDTLWDIARQYLGNPFRYPELAKLSQIRNPDLIHPGDRVHIKKKIAAPRK